MPAFRRDPSITRQVSFVDLLYVCVITFGLVPAVSFAAGYASFTLVESVDGNLILVFSGLLAAFGYTGLLAWAGIPIALLAGWWATRLGWLGWGSGMGLGFVGGMVFSIPFIGGTDVRLIDAEILSIIFFFAAIGALYGCIGYLSLLWLRADLLSLKHRGNTDEISED